MINRPNKQPSKVVKYYKLQNKISKYLKLPLISLPGANFILLFQNPCNMLTCIPFSHPTANPIRLEYDTIKMIDSMVLTGSKVSKAS